MSILLRGVLAASILSLCATPVMALPIQYRISMTVGGDPGVANQNLNGADLDLTLTLDPTGLSPINSTPLLLPTRQTQWKTSNTVATVEVSAAGAYDGVYPGTVQLTPYWTLSHVPGLYSSVFFPRTTFDVGGLSVEIGPGVIKLDPSFYASLTTIPPKPFSSAKVTEFSTFITVSGPRSGADKTATNVIASGVNVPEPGTVVLAGAGAVGALALLRRRNGEPE